MGLVESNNQKVVKKVCVLFMPVCLLVYTWIPCGTTLPSNTDVSTYMELHSILYMDTMWYYPALQYRC